MPCPYANALGVPGEGVHAARIFGLARNDLIMTVIAAIITAYAFNISFLYSFTAWFVAGEVLHYAFGTNTAFLKMIGMSPNCEAQVPSNPPS
jgi:hypothetical protein